MLHLLDWIAESGSCLLIEQKNLLCDNWGHTSVTCFSAANSITTVAQEWLRVGASPHVWSRLKCLNNCWMDKHELLNIQNTDVPHMMNLGDPLTFSLLPPWHWHDWHVDFLPWILVRLSVAMVMNPNDFNYPPTFPPGWHLFGFQDKFKMFISCVTSVFCSFTCFFYNLFQCLCVSYVN